MVLDSETVEGRLPTSLLGVGGATTKTQNKEKATTGRSAKEEISRHPPVALWAYLTILRDPSAPSRTTSF